MSRMIILALTLIATAAPVTDWDSDAHAVIAYHQRCQAGQISDVGLCRATARVMPRVCTSDPDVTACAEHLRRHAGVGTS